MTRIMALDISTTKTGIAWGTETRIEQTHLRDATDWQHMAERLVGWVLADIHEVIAIEDIYLARNPQTLKTLAMLHGAVRFAVRHRTVLVASTAEIDAACGIPLRLTRKARKEATRRLAEALLPNWPMSEDECDAVALLVWAQGQVKQMNWREEADNAAQN
jgi:Holliday junction resolvasome RuvABC endonuclease subunit